MSLVLSFPLVASANVSQDRAFSIHIETSSLVFISLLLLIILVGAVLLKSRVSQIAKTKSNNIRFSREDLEQHVKNLSSSQIDALLSIKREAGTSASQPSNVRTSLLILVFVSLGLVYSPNSVFAQNTDESDSLFTQSGILITIILILIPIILGLGLMIVKINSLLHQYRTKQNLARAEVLAAYLKSLPLDVEEQTLLKRKNALDYQLSNTELSGVLRPEDDKGIINISTNSALPVVPIKKRAQKRPGIDPKLSKLILWYIGCATFWLLFGTTVGEYLGVKFVSPDVDQLSWLTFGRLRPVHTNAVFWGWASLAMIGLGCYVVPTVSNVPLASLRKGWAALVLINTAVVTGTLSLMAGINNGGGEYREYVWPIMLLFGVGLALTLVNFLSTIARRKTKEIYISNWYIVAAIIFTIVISVVAYVPVWQNGLGETIIQGYYMHQGVGMWFMLFTLGVVYYFLPQQLNKPIYSYSLGILAFWTQILFYTLIGTHHFVFSSIPWWLQTVAIVGSVGMVIPVAAGTTNFLMTFKGAWHKVAGSYTLPFFLVGIIFYFTGSLQGTAEAFRFTNLVWHFTDFTVAHSHLTMYGIISFFMWAGIYAVVPRITGKEPPQIIVGAHFWLALIGLLFYTIPLMYGSTMKGLLWMEGKPFIDSVTLMAPHWLWRAIGGSFMWLSHLFFAYNVYVMIWGRELPDVRETAIKKLENERAALTTLQNN